MSLVHLDDVYIRFRGPLLLDGVSCQIESGQRIGLLGRNGAGKTTLMRLVAGETVPDNGKVIVSPGARVAKLQQDVPQEVTGPLVDVVREGLPDEDRTIENAWRGDQRVEQLLQRMNLVAEVAFESLSSGMKRRVLLAKCLAGEPDLLLLDEPTNHLDIDAITWLEGFLSSWSGTLLFVTHDREFLRRLATRIIEIDRGRLFDWSCDYDNFLKRKEDWLAAEEKQNALFDRRLAEEERWIRQGIKARRTRNEGRVRALKKMRVERSERRDRVGTSKLKIQEAQRSGALVADAKEVSFAYEQKPIFTDFSTSLMRGDKVGIIGPNGAGKTTLLRVLLGELEPQAGSVRLGTNLQIAYFDQLRDQLDDNQTVQECVGDGYENITINGQSRHVMGYLQDFLFTPERARTQVRFLSGGERNRVLLAKLFAKPANVIVLDEPTNDLDAETLELLEERLIEYSGTLLTVSHDREFLNNVVTSTIVFEPDPEGGTQVREYVGGYDDWRRQYQAAQKTAAQEAAVTETPKPLATGKDQSAKAAPEKSKKKLSYNEQRELKALPKKIEQLEATIEELHTQMAAPEFYQGPSSEIAAKQAEVTDLQAELATAYERWETLEG